MGAREGIARSKGTELQFGGTMFSQSVNCSARSATCIMHFSQNRIKKNISRLSLPVLLVSLFNGHDFVNPYRVGIDVVKQGIFHRYVHTPTGFACREFPDIPRCTRMIRQPLDMLTDHPAIFPGSSRMNSFTRSSMLIFTLPPFRARVPS